MIDVSQEEFVTPTYLSTYISPSKNLIPAHRGQWHDNRLEWKRETSLVKLRDTKTILSYDRENYFKVLINIFKKKKELISLFSFDYKYLIVRGARKF